ncbi:unnamed protein product [Owenia fusiformis]|uniref:PrdX deacylase domain-containing protein 1 n=1 Tax=Owenia fusiformis TaxID=6347 RepID=A0A8J1U3G0_OWEFU|nr:unnamed protein product [Owenia fusiformis]
MAEHFDKERLLAKFKELGIESDTIDHPEVFTVEAMMPYVDHLPGAHCKNLFLKDKKKQLYLVSCIHDRDFKLNDLAKKISASGGLRFADESILFENLGVKQGCVTAYALVNDIKGNVNFYVDSDLVNDTHEKVWFHPISNAASTALTPKDFVKFVEATGHKINTVEF